ITDHFSGGRPLEANLGFQYDAKRAPNAIILRYAEGGQLVNRCDYSRVLRVIQNTQKSKTVVVYVHGWRNDSGQKDELLYNYRGGDYTPQSMGGDLKSFNEFLGRLRNEDNERPVIGIFVSWKGGTGIPVLETLSYTNRRNGADKIGNAGGLPRLMGAIANISKAQETMDPKCAQKKNLTDECVVNQLIYIGHSFGARILYKAVVDDMIVNTQLEHPSDPYNSSGPAQLSLCDRQERFNVISSTADLVVLLNPAFEAASYQALNEFRYADRCFSEDQQPLMVTIQSKGDKANRIYFPIGQVLSMEWTRLETQAVGFRKQYFSHHLKRISNKDCPVQRRLSELPISNSTPELYNGYCLNGISLEYEPSASDVSTGQMRLSPFLVITADDTVLDGHGWYSGRENKNDDFKAWLVGYLSQYQPQPPGVK
ncbi:hypothetical protein, partial [Hyphomonas oceanitis]